MCQEEEDLHIIYACANRKDNNDNKNKNNYLSKEYENYNKQLEQQIFTYAPASVTNKNRNMCWRKSNQQLNYIFILLYCLTCFCLAVKGASTGSLTTSHKQHRQTGLYAWNNFTEIEHDSEVIKEKERHDNDFDAESSVLETTTNTECPLTTSSHCLRCNVDGCIKCPMYLVTDTRQCVDQCPSGYIDQWSAHAEFMGRVCISTGYSGPIMAALAGMLGGFVFCLTLLGFAIMLMRRKRRRKTIKQKLINEHTMDRADFLRQLNDMRPNAEYFLAMLNDTRRQIRKLYLAGDMNAANAYRPVVRDLAKILILLNRPIELIPSAPHDWNRIYTWADQALERYKPQFGQLIDLFQSAAIDTDHATDDPEANLYRPKGNSSVFKQNAVQQLNAGNIRTNGSSTTHKMHMFGSLISLHEFEEPRASDPFGSSFNTLKSGNLITDLNASSLWLEDEFYKLGFRPQDEITTEL